ncbi:MAG: transglycosylase SLT domain-containing protein [Anaerolineae bacterium]|nr:transglycosylase SLT domain-containing protein [Anaerolineae bacterium]
MQYRHLIFAVVLLAAVIAFVFPYPSLAQGGGTSGGGDSAESVLSPYWPYAVRRWESIIVEYAAERNLDPDFIAAVIWKESKGNPEARSIVGAVGLMQLMPSDWRPAPEKLKEPSTNLFWGARALAQTVRDGGGDIYYSLAAYNGGWNQIHLRVTRRYATEVMDCYARAIAVRYGLPEDGHWLAVFATEGADGPKTITVLGPHRSLVRYTERPGIQTHIPVVPDGFPPQATVITFEDEWGDEIRVETWLVTEDGSPLASLAGDG